MPGSSRLAPGCLANGSAGDEGTGEVDLHESSPGHPWRDCWISDRWMGARRPPLPCVELVCVHRDPVTLSVSRRNATDGTHQHRWPWRGFQQFSFCLVGSFLLCPGQVGLCSGGSMTSLPSCRAELGVGLHPSLGLQLACCFSCGLFIPCHAGVYSGLCSSWGWIDVCVGVDQGVHGRGRAGFSVQPSSLMHSVYMLETLDELLNTI